MKKSSRSEIFEDRVNFLRRVPIFSELELDAQRELSRRLTPLSLPKGACLYQEGDPGDALYVLESGRVKIVTKENGREKVLNYLVRGDSFGGVALLTGAKRSVTALIDATASFLVLYRKDFDAFLKKDPAASFYLSRLISQRLSVARKDAMVPSLKPEALGFFCDASREERTLFLTNLALSLKEQTRRRVLLLTLDPRGSEILKALGLDPNPAVPPAIGWEEFKHPKVLEKITRVHSSGLEIIWLKEEIFSSTLFRSIPALISFFREIYDFILVDPRRDRPDPWDDVTASTLSECDAVYYVSSGPGSKLEELKTRLPGAQTVRTIALGKDPSRAFRPDFTIPWSGRISSILGRGFSPVLSVPGAELTWKMFGRIARSIGRLQVGFALGSGAAYGYTSIGMLKVFEREKIPVDFISGTSMGALLGAFSASGLSALEIESIAHSITKSWLRGNILGDLNLPWPHGGVLLGQTISRFLKKYLGEADFTDLFTPFGCVATDIMTGDGVVLREGKVWQAVRASLSLPMVFCPPKLGERYLVDGGLVNPVPTSVIASMGADILISAHLTNKASERKVALRRLGIFPARTPGMVSIFFKMLYTMQYQIATLRTDPSHIVIHPETKRYSWLDLHRAKQIIPLGEEAAAEALTKIKARLPYFADTCQVPARPGPGLRY
ncbi:MAG: hypothetical protein A2902_01470 [Elusimicrobia bacterium RIFCSPLOWO2_01_FULL_64_13]|nr:MAG: hypothetical protein A2902_01470 [Elusimicrobia bacterium RIFCSPLOWO2_01_FULL_64_13]